MDPYSIRTRSKGPCGVTFVAGYIWVSNYGTSTIIKMEPPWVSKPPPDCC